MAGLPRRRRRLADRLRRSRASGGPPRRRRGRARWGHGMLPRSGREMARPAAMRRARSRVAGAVLRRMGWTATRRPASRMRISSASCAPRPRAASGRARCRVAADADHALVGDPPLELEHGAEGAEPAAAAGLGLLVGEGLGDDAAGGGVHAHVGDRVEPVGELRVEIVEVAEASGRGRSPRGCSGTAARPCPSSWPGRAGRLWAGSRNAGRGRPATGCRRCGPRHPRR